MPNESFSEKNKEQKDIDMEKEIQNIDPKVLHEIKKEAFLETLKFLRYNGAKPDIWTRLDYFEDTGFDADEAIRMTNEKIEESNERVRQIHERHKE